ncbi:hypothetical protein MJG53_006653 [Ovis ammon polii x Ovis aries]|uniref:Uncharacterized protein n=1 Tax=Ovis ammon polii x Ovis aries TaxID=2918886 RepID=A0ACB9V5S5_9CETA|nr:hypothetical protein MJG53_006653 [Ovis ammon polii x Ovis aries]
MNPSSSAGEEKGATGGSSSSGSGAGSCCLGAEGGADPRGAGAAAAAALEEPGAAGPKEKDEALEEKLRNLTFRKQVSYRDDRHFLSIPTLARSGTGDCQTERVGGNTAEDLENALFLYSGDKELNLKNIRERDSSSELE